MRARPVFLITHAYPYGDGEAFLDAELEVLSRRFPRITCLPGRATGTPRPLPPGIELDRSLAGKEARTIGKTARTLAAPLRTHLALREAWACVRYAWRPRGMLRLLTETRRAVAARSVLGRILERPETRDSEPIVYSYWFNGHAVGAAAACRRAPRARAVARAHGMDIYEDRLRPPWIPFRTRFPAGLAAIFPVSLHGRAHLVARFPDESARITLSRLGVKDPGADAEASSDGTFRLLSCSFCVPVKRLDRLARGVALRARSDATPIEWTHLGGGPGREELRELAGEVLPSHVTFRAPGQVSHGEVLAHYRRRPVDAFAPTSASEGLPVSIMEALSFGVPVLATRVGGIPEIVDSSLGGLLSADPEPAEVAAGLDRLAGASPADRAARRVAAKEAWRRDCRADVNFAQFADLLRGEGASA